MPDGYYRCMAEMATWMTRNRPAVINVQPGPYPEKCNVPMTVHGRTCYAHLLPKANEGGASDGRIVLDASLQPRRAVLLTTGQELPLRADGNQVTIDVPDAQRTDLVDVIAIEVK